MIDDLAKYGPMKPENERGLSEEALNVQGNELRVGPNDDPTGIRVGKPPSEEVQATLRKTAADLARLVSKDMAAHKQVADPRAIADAMQLVKGATMMAYPMGLPEWDSVRLCLEDKENLEGTEASKHTMPEDACYLWFAGKQMMRDEATTLGKYTGKNEKTTIKAKLQRDGKSAPQRQPAMSEEERAKLTAYYHKKERDAELLKEAEDDEGSFLNSAWANPKAFKHQSLGLGAVRWRPGAAGG